MVETACPYLALNQPACTSNPSLAVTLFCSCNSADNLHYVAGNLLIQEDTGRHENNVLWAYNVDKGTLTRILSTPR